MSENMSSRNLDKIDLWERKLLDLTTRNALLNVKIKGNTIPLFVTSSCDLEDSISAEKEYVIVSRTQSANTEETQPEEEQKAIPAGDYDIEKLAEISEFNSTIRSANDRGIIYSSLADKELEDKLKALYRNSRTALEEDGAGTLFLACGFLKWYDEKKESGEPYYAPAVLIPVELIRKFGVGKYVLRKTDEDAIMNRSLTEKLKRDFDIDITELDGDLKDDASGKNVKGVLDTLTSAVSTKPGWKVIDTCVLEMFSFSKFVMWNDLRLHRDELASNKIVKSLLDGHLAWQYEDMEKNAEGFKGNDKILLPINADNSQLYAIQRAGEGNSFVLHGPPGTGKSQTITSMIANAVANGQTVLFAAEKKAALDVVYSRLTKIGLAPFCLELHSNKIRKGWVLDQLKEALEFKLKNMPESGYDKTLDDITKRRDELDIYADTLTETRSCGYSLYEMLCVYADNADAPDVILGDGYEDGLTEERINASETILAEYLAVSGGLSGVLPDVSATEYSQETKVKLPAELSALTEAAGKYETSFAAFRTALPRTASSDDTASADKACAKANNFLAARRQILQNWEKDFLSADADRLVKAYAEASSKWGPFRSMSMNKVYNEVKAFDKNGNCKDGLGEHLSALKSYKDTFSGLGFDPSADVPSVIPEFISAGKEFSDAREAVFTRLGVSDLRSGADGVSFGRVRQIVAAIDKDKDRIRDKTIANKTAAKCDELKLRPVIKAYGDGILSEGNLISGFMKAWSKLMICKIIDDNEVLSEFSGKVFDERVAKLRQLGDEFRDITRQEIIIRVAKRLPDFGVDANSSSMLGILQRAIKSRGRGVSIRSLFRDVQELILKLTPCVLMSPISAAQFIAPSKEPLFDLVVFDEASQLPTCEAVGAIARGKNAVIVGDPMQMPPTAFFRDQTSSEENYDTEDLESILDDCLAVGMPQTRLLWHYRSRHESLITFSNRCFYDSKLYTFPSADNRASRVTLVKCGGVFDSGRTRINEAEARAVTEELVARSRDPELSRLSYGVVTFNIQQQNLIEDMVDEVCRQDEAFEKWAYGGDEPVFIKNLENVQGDERDVILFSVNYGPDAEGKVSMNFGPINKDGGWRRLNVAVTRSRCEMKVFSSLPPERIKVTEATPEGVLAFRRFLLYAEGNGLWDADISGSTASSGPSFEGRSAKFKGIRDDICRRLREKGYYTDTGIGSSEFKVDIGVMDSPDAENYCLGILIDGSAGSESSATGREIEQPATLKGLGWNVYKVWSIEWWENADQIIDECINAIRSPESMAVEESVTEAPAVSEEPAVAEVEPVTPAVPESGSEPQTQKKTEFAVDPSSVISAPYVKADICLPPLTGKDFCDPKNLGMIESAAKTIIETEAPICFDLFVDRLTEACGIKRKTAPVKERCEYIIKRFRYPVSSVNLTNHMEDGYSDPEYSRLFIYKNDDDIGRIMSSYRTGSKDDMRDPTHIPLEEAACAAVYLAKTQYGMPFDDLVFETGKALGFPLSSPTVKLMASKAIDLAVEKGALIRGERMVKPSNNQT